MSGPALACTVLTIFATIVLSFAPMAHSSESDEPHNEKLRNGEIESCGSLMTQLQFAASGEALKQRAPVIVRELALKHPLLFGEAYTQTLRRFFESEYPSVWAEIKEMTPSLEYEYLRGQAETIWDYYLEQLKSHREKGAKDLAAFLGVDDEYEALVVYKTSEKLGKEAHREHDKATRELILELVTFTLPTFAKIAELEGTAFNSKHRQQARLFNEAERLKREIFQKIFTGELAFRPVEVAPLDLAKTGLSLSAAIQQYEPQAAKIQNALLNFDGLSRPIILIGETVNKLQKSLLDSAGLAATYSATSRIEAYEFLQEVTTNLDQMATQLSKVEEDLNILKGRILKEKPPASDPTAARLYGVSSSWAVRTGHIKASVGNFLRDIQSIKEELTLRDTSIGDLSVALRLAFEALKQGLANERLQKRGSEE